MSSQPPTSSGEEYLNLKQVARMLDVHYMTVYRYVRQGRLPAHQDGQVWLVKERDALAFRDKAARPAVSASNPSGRSTVNWPERLMARLVEGDEIGGWQVLLDALASGCDYAQVHLEIVTGALGLVGAQCTTNKLSDVHERVAVATASRLVVRLGANFPHQGRKRGVVVLAAPTDEHHGLPLILLANLIRRAGFKVLELGTDTPTAALLQAVEAAINANTQGKATPLVAVGLGVTTVGRLDATRETVETIRAVYPALPVLLGGQAVRNAEMAELIGATHWSTGPDLVEQLTQLAKSRRNIPKSTV